MTLRDFRIGWRLLVGEPAYSAVVVAGLALGFAACFLLLGFVLYTFGYNSQVPGADRVYLIKQRVNVFPRPDWETDTGRPLRDIALKSGLADDAAILTDVGAPLLADGRLHRLDLKAVDPFFAAIFGIAALEGDLRAALERPDGLALTRQAALKLFGDTHALGRTVRLEGEPLQIKAILADPSANTTQAYEALLGSAGNAAREPRLDKDDIGWRSGRIYVRLKPGASVAALVKVLQDATDRSPINVAVRTGDMGKKLGGQKVTDIGATALPDVYFDRDLKASRDGANYGDKDSVFGLAAIAMLILLLAGSNYVHLASARTLRRRREIGMRKLLGAGAARVAAQFLAESTLAALLAAVFGLTMAWLSLPLFSDLAGRRLDGFFTVPRCAAALISAAAIGLLAGAYPARIALGVRAASALSGRGNDETAASVSLRRVLTVMQFAAAMGLTAATLTVAWQTDYATHADTGFDPAGLLVLDLPGDSGDPASSAFAAALARQKMVTGVATASEAVGRDGMKIISSIRLADGNAMRMETKFVSSDFFAVYGLRPVVGRLFDAALDNKGSAAVVVNAAAAVAIGYATPQAAVGKFLPPSGEGKAPQRILGIAPDLRYRTLRETAAPLLYRLGDASVLTLRSGDDVATAYRNIAPLWQRYFPDRLLELHTAQSFFAANYAEDARLARILGAASLIAIALAAFGIYVLSAYTVQRKRREIVLRKLHGAGHGDIALMLAREYAALIGLGAAIGLPLAAFAGQRYLAGFVERAPLGVWPLLAALALAVLTALLATARHALAALGLAPVQALRD
jgi:ABC-type antimicrobial peptide transport system permease subunit